MRDILFRGKQVNDKTWAYGYLSKGRLHGYKGNTLQPCIDYEDAGVMLSSVVDSDTVGQWTEKTDKNGAKIFEGDICRFSYFCNSYVGVVRYKNGSFAVAWEIVVGAYGEKATHTAHLRDARNLTVIGNIYDNPELLEAES